MAPPEDRRLAGVRIDQGVCVHVRPTAVAAIGHDLRVENEIAFGLESLGVPSSDIGPRVKAAAASVGLADRLGSIEPGKEADLAIWDGDPLLPTSHVTHTILGGQVVYQKGEA